jgi:uncharacterized protein with NAD-binding domain and iron-sulfur cluster
MAGLVTAWDLSAGDWRSRLDSITVYQRGWRLGGKGASSRGAFDRIEEHGLHVLLGYYDATFRVLREVYAELDRPSTDPSCPIQTWQDAVAPGGDVGLADRDGATWQHFVTRFSTTDSLPGEPGAEHRPLTPAHIATSSLRLLADFHRSLGSSAAPGRVYLSGSPTPRPDRADVAGLVRGGGLTALAVMLEALEQACRMAADASLTAPAVESFARLLSAWRDGVHAAVLADPSARRTWHLVDLVVTNLRGMVVDGLLVGAGFDGIDHLDYREWLARHGAGPDTLDSPIVCGMYDLVFAYERGDRSRPRFAAGLGLQLAARMLFDFKGSIFWRMQAGMGEVVFAPLYQALERRGVQVRFFHRLDDIEVDEHRSVRAIRLTRQVDLAPGRTRYEPLVRVDGLPCWPDHPLVEQLAADPGTELESHWWAGSGSGADSSRAVRLAAGEHFDVAVLAVSLGMVPHVASQLVSAEPAWRRMVDEVATVPTQAAQLWFEVPEREMGWDGPAEVTLSGFGNTFDTWASMPHLLPREGWPAGHRPRSLAYLCGAMPDPGPDPDPDLCLASVHDTLVRFLDDEVGALWPAVAGPTGFRWQALWDDQGRCGPDRLTSQYVRANVDPSDRYVQSLPGSGRHRLAPGRTGFSNLAIAGDWTACGLDAGCVEAATRSGTQAARAILDGHVRLATTGTPAGREPAA